MPIIRCPHCDDRVEIDDDWYGRRISCPSCDQSFTPKRTGRSDDDTDGEDRPRRRAFDNDDGDDRPRPRRRSKYDDDGPAKKKGNPVLWVVLTLVVVFVVLPCGGCIGFFVWANNAQESFNDPWADASAGTPPVVTASFPKPPVPKYPTVVGSTGGEMVGYSNVNDGNKMLDVEFGLGYLDFPAGTPDPLGSNYAAIRKEVEGRFMDNPVLAPQVAREGVTTVNGYPAKETVYNDDTGNHVLRVVHLNDRPANQPARLVVIVVGGPHLKDADKQKFLNSVRFGKK